MKIRTPNGSNRWTDADEQVCIVRYGIIWHKTKYGHLRKTLGAKWADAWLWRTHCTGDIDRLTILNVLVRGGPYTQQPMSRKQLK